MLSDERLLGEVRQTSFIPGMKGYWKCNEHVAKSMQDILERRRNPNDNTNIRDESDLPGPHQRRERRVRRWAEKHNVD